MTNQKMREWIISEGLASELEKEEKQIVTNVRT